MTEVSIKTSELGALGELVGAGGQAEVFHLSELRLADAPGPLVYKRYKATQRPVHGPHRVVASRNGLDPAARARLDQRAAWPLRVVEEAGVVYGVVLPLIDAPYFQQVMLPSGRITRTPREVQHLLVPEDRARRIGMPCPGERERLIICRDFAAALHLVHGRNLVVGDLNSRNALFRLDARPTVMLVDCDAIRVKGSAAAVAQLEAPDWEVPDERLSQASDRYKFGLFVLRCLADGEQRSITRDPSRADRVLDTEGRRLLRSALDDDPTARPTVQEWGLYLQGLQSGVPTAALTAQAGTAPRVSGSHATTATSGWRRDPASGHWQRA